jgi:prepilin-type N-terminal cleavage/methylation domain-containing protein
MNRRAAFTLIEVMIVFAVIAILAMIAIPNFLEAQTRSKVARAKTDLAAITASLRAYCADYNAYPPNRPEFRAYFKDCADGITTGSSMAVHYSGQDLFVLTTPVAYHRGLLPKDIHRSSRTAGSKEGYYPYVNVLDVTTDSVTVTGAFRRYILTSAGPDQQYSAPDPVRGPFIPYDPTNGTVSSGDIYRFGW